MPSVAAAATYPSNAALAAPAARVPQKVLGQGDFLKLLATQFKTQDPMKPVEDTAFIAQMAQFSALEQSGTMALELAALRLDQSRTSANSYLGHRVTVQTNDGTGETGDVTAIDATGSAPQIVLNGKSYPLSAVLRVEPGFIPSLPPPSVPAAGA